MCLLSLFYVLWKATLHKMTGRGKCFSAAITSQLAKLVVCGLRIFINLSIVEQEP